MNNTNYCNNCGIKGHIFYQCKHPITSASDDKPATPHVCSVYDMKPVMMCGTHRNKLSVQYGDGEGGLPYVYGFDEADAMKSVVTK